MPGFRHRNSKNKTESKGERCFYLNTDNENSSTTLKILLSSRVCSYCADVTWGYRRAPFVGEMPTLGDGAVVDASAVALAAAPAVATVTGSGVFPAASARGAAGAHASSAGAAAAAAALPTNGARGTSAARGDVFPTPPVDWTTTRHDQPPETATIQRRRY